MVPLDHQYLGKSVTDDEAARWSTRVLARNPSYSTFLKHWLPERMPPSFRTGLLFIDDSQQFPSLEAMVDEYLLETFQPK